MGLALPILAAADPVAHVVDKPLVTSADGTIWYISNVTIMLLLAGLIAALALIPAARKIATGPSRSLEDYRTRGLWANLVESICLYLREDVFRPVLGEQTDKFAPMLWTFFWFILICNLMGLVPLLDLTALLGWGHEGHGIGGTATQSIWVTGALAVTAFLFWNIVAFVKDPVGFLKHLTAGAPWYMWWIMVPVEIMGMFVKPVALALRLFANMTGGHIILAVLLSFIVALIENLGTVGYGMALIPLLGSVAINLLELMVAFLQAFIFTFLTTLFLGQLVVHEHEDHDEHAHEGHEHLGRHNGHYGPSAVEQALGEKPAAPYPPTARTGVH